MPVNAKGKGDEGTCFLPLRLQFAMAAYILSFPCHMKGIQPEKTTAQYLAVVCNFCYC